jgi:UDP-glucose 4-epimerase
MQIFVTGGAGYIGSVTVEQLVSAGYRVTVFDNLSRGHIKALSPEVKLIQGDLGKAFEIADALASASYDAVIHFAASSLVGESVLQPLDYYQNNLAGGANLLRAMLANNVKKIIFSSTAAIFGEPAEVPISEAAPKNPTNPYGRTKLFFEQMLADCDAAHGLKSVCLRYFNAAGASDCCGEDHHPETHLIPLVLEVTNGKRKEISVFGSDYPTPDGTCVRDYIHVSDLARAHLLALKYLVSQETSNAFNLGNGSGYSVLEIVSAAKRVTGRDIPIKMSDRRPGDPAVLVASSEKIRSILGWSPEFPQPDAMLKSAWEWMLKNPDGYSN